MTTETNKGERGGEVGEMIHLEAPDRLMECQLSGNTSADRRVGQNLQMTSMLKNINKLNVHTHMTTT